MKQAAPLKILLLAVLFLSAGQTAMASGGVVVERLLNFCFLQFRGTDALNFRRTNERALVENNFSQIPGSQFFFRGAFIVRLGSRGEVEIFVHGGDSDPRAIGCRAEPHALCLKFSTGDRLFRALGPSFRPMIEDQPLRILNMVPRRPDGEGNVLLLRNERLSLVFGVDAQTPNTLPDGHQKLTVPLDYFTPDQLGVPSDDVINASTGINPYPPEVIAKDAADLKKILVTPDMISRAILHMGAAKNFSVDEFEFGRERFRINWEDENTLEITNLRNQRSFSIFGYQLKRIAQFGYFGEPGQADRIEPGVILQTLTFLLEE